jgi:hypothetical protein
VSASGHLSFSTEVVVAKQLLAESGPDVASYGEKGGLAKRVQILSLLCEGSSMRSISRVVDVSINTVAKMLVDAGEACAAFHEENVRDVQSKRVQVDEIWSFCAAKQKNFPNMKKPVDGAGDVWTWTALDADSKLIVQWFVGGRDALYTVW